MGDVKRKHHFVPVFYLAGFTASGGKDDWLTIHDLISGDTRQSKPNAIGYEKNLYQFDQAGIDPNIIENTLNEKVEGPMSLVMERLNSPSLPLNPDGYQVLMRFLALLALRVPHIRRLHATFATQIEQAMNSMVFDSPEHFRWFIEKMDKEGIRLPDGTDLEAIRQQLLRKPPKVLDQNWQMETMLENTDALVSVFAARSWSLLVAKDGVGDFLCSDNPVGMKCTDPEMHRFPMGYGRVDVIMTVPLSRRMALFGQYGGHSFLMEVDEKQVAFINNQTATFAERHLYASGPDSPIMLADGKVARWPEYLLDRRTYIDEGDQ